MSLKQEGPIERKLQKGLSPIDIYHDFIKTQIFYLTRKVF